MFQRAPDQARKQLQGRMVHFIFCGWFIVHICLRSDQIREICQFSNNALNRKADGCFEIFWGFVPSAETDVFRPQTDQLIEPYLRKPLEEQDAFEGTRFKTKDTHRNRWRTSHHQVLCKNHINRPQGRGERSQVFTTISIASRFSKISMDFPR
jgi:hypothetical protein